jgi:hypothetical protein
VSLLREQRSLRVPAGECDALLAELMVDPQVPPLDLPVELRYEEVRAAPRPRLTVKPAPLYKRQDSVLGELDFDYGGSIVASAAPARGIIRSAERRVVLRDLEAERVAAEILQRLGWRLASGSYGPSRGSAQLEIASRRLPASVRELAAAGWHIEAEGKAFRTASRFDIEVTSGVDWFELHASLEFGDGVSARLPELLAAVRRGEDRVALDDGSLGLIPEDWLARYGLLTGRYGRAETSRSNRTEQSLGGGSYHQQIAIYRQACRHDTSGRTSAMNRSICSSALAYGSPSKCGKIVRFCRPSRSR